MWAKCYEKWSLDLSNEQKSNVLIHSQKEMQGGVRVSWELHNGDSAEVLKTFKAESIDLTVTSPPYDNLRMYNGYSFDFETIAQELYRVTKQGGIVVWVVGDATVKGSETGTGFRQVLWFMDVGFNLHDTMIYLKENPPPVGGHSRYYQRFEYMFVFSKGKPKTFNPIMLERRNKWNDKRTHRFKGFTRDKNGEFVKKYTKLNTVVKAGNVWQYTVSGGAITSDKIAHRHPAIFPDKLASDHITSWSNPGDTVLDPFAGSGTTLKMAEKLGRNGIGIELSNEYCEIIKERMANIQPTFL